MQDACKGVWPVMLTPFLKDGRIDWAGVDTLTDWYIDQDVAGFFTVCLSSEMFALSDPERLQLAKRVVDRTRERIPVVASGIRPVYMDEGHLLPD
jgi:4-hydroxy-tetrahydrodipicolinate synthase